MSRTTNMTSRVYERIGPVEILEVTIRGERQHDVVYDAHCTICSPENEVLATAVRLVEAYDEAQRHRADRHSADGADALTIADIHYADLVQHPPERTDEGTCAHCENAARWVVLTVPAAAVRVCAKHLGKIWNAQGRPEVPGGDRS